jgi:hypothetical protein
MDIIRSARHLLWHAATDMFRKPGTPYLAVPFIPKPRIGRDSPEPWTVFGSTQEEYERWIPEVCGICCLKMAGDTFGLTTHLTLYQLTLHCLELGGFRIRKDGSIEGVFHRPLVRLARELGLRSIVERKLGTPDIIRYLAMNRMVVLSIDLGKVPGQNKDARLTGGHLILVHRFLPNQGTFLIHDCSRLLGKTGRDISLTPEALERISNQRGLVLWLGR